MDNEISALTSKGDTQQVLALFNNAEHDLPPNLSRRKFCTYTGLSLSTLILPGCTEKESKTPLKKLGMEAQFIQFFDIIFPAESLGLDQYKAHALSRIQRITEEDALEIKHLYKRFKGLLWLKSDLGTKDYTRAIGEDCMIDLLHSKYAEECNVALDTLYLELSKERKLIEALWGRPYSLTDKKCVYWDTYDQAVR